MYVSDNLKDCNTQSGAKSAGKNERKRTDEVLLSTFLKDTEHSIAKVILNDISYIMS